MRGACGWWLVVALPACAPAEPSPPYTLEVQVASVGPLVEIRIDGAPASELQRTYPSYDDARAAEPITFTAIRGELTASFEVAAGDCLSYLTADVLEEPLIEERFTLRLIDQDGRFEFGRTPDPFSCTDHTGTTISGISVR